MTFALPVFQNPAAASAAMGWAGLQGCGPLVAKRPATLSVVYHSTSNVELGVLPQGKGVWQDQPGQRQRSPKAPLVPDVQG